MLRLQDNPPMTLPSLATLDDAPGNWTAIYCKPRQEKALAWDLCRKEVPYFLPMLERETSSGGRRRRNLYPLFKSYVFFAGDDPQRLSVFKTNRLVRLVEIDQALQPSFRREISSLQLTLTATPEDLQLYPQLVVGKRVLVTGGPMKGAEGTILSADDMTKLWIGVTMMGTGVTVEVHADMVEPLPSSESNTKTTHTPGRQIKSKHGKIELPVGGGRHVDAK